MVFKIICVGSIPAILVIRLTCYKSSKLHRLSRHVLLNKKKKYKSRWFSKLKLLRSSLKSKSNLRALRLLKSKYRASSTQLRFNSSYLTTDKAVSVNSSYYSALASAKTSTETNTRVLSALYFSLVYLKGLPYSKSKTNNSGVTPLLYKLSSVLNASPKTINTTNIIFKPERTCKPLSSLQKSALGLQVGRAWSLNTFSGLVSAGLTSEPIIAHDGTVPLIFFSSIDSKPEFLINTPLLTHEDFFSGVSSSLKRVKHYLSLKNKLVSVSEKSVAAKTLESARLAFSASRRTNTRNSFRLNRNRRSRLKRRRLHVKLFRSTPRLKLSKLASRRKQGRLALVYARTYHAPRNDSVQSMRLTSPSAKVGVIDSHVNATDLISFNSASLSMLSTHKKLSCSNRHYTNMYPDSSSLRTKLRNFSPQLTRQLDFYPDITPWVTDTLIRLIESCAGKRAIVQHNMNVEHMVESQSKLIYRTWIIRMAYYERTLGHRFFMEEALHIMHLSLRLHDVKLFSSWLKAIITRISFWKTRSIFRFLKYVFNNYYRYMFDSLSVKGIKIRLKGKISAAGNSRKRTILFRSGQNSYSSVNVKCLHEFKTITTFTGVMGFQVWLFY